MSYLLELVVYGVPAPQGSKSGFVNKATQKVVMKESSRRAPAWREDVRRVAREGMGALPPYDDALTVDVVFTVAKPKSAPKRRRTFPATQPDVDKLLRSTLDALQSAGVYTSDGRVVRAVAEKVYPGEHPRALQAPGCHLLLGRPDGYTGPAMLTDADALLLP